MVIIFTAPWCMPCERLKYRISQTPTNLLRDITWVDIEQSPEKVDEYAITSVPTAILFDEHNEIQHQWVGRIPREAYTRESA